MVGGRISAYEISILHIWKGCISPESYTQIFKHLLLSRNLLPYPENNATLDLIQQHLFPHERKMLERPRTVDQLENY